jgi:hypothetical protein
VTGLFTNCVGFRPSFDSGYVQPSLEQRRSTAASRDESLGHFGDE